MTAGSGVGEDDVVGDCDVGDGAVTADSGVGEDDVTGDSGVGDGPMAAGSGADEGISGVAIVHPANSNITSVSGIRIRDSCFIFDPPSLRPVWILLI